LHVQDVGESVKLKNDDSYTSKILLKMVWLYYYIVINM
jgi:hypothetical protein